METFALPGAGAIIERFIDGHLCILMQQRKKDHAPHETGLLEIPAGKIREFESIYDCLRREVEEETGLRVVEITGEDESEVVEQHGYRTISFHPFACAQNIRGDYPIMVMVFICRVEGEAMPESNESSQIQWMPIADLAQRLTHSPKTLYPMHVSTLRKYLRHRGVAPVALS